MSAQSCQASVQKVKDERAENEPDRLVEAISREIGVGALKERALKNFERGSKSTKQISRRH